VWGLAFKPKTDDMREAPSIEVIEGLLRKGAKVQAFDPVAPHTRRGASSATASPYCERQYDALEGADALLVVTEWNEFRHPDFDRLKSTLKTPVVFDGRNIFSPAKLRELGFTYYGIGR
jgi:UDPglucose 6-dehydrogenase